MLSLLLNVSNKEPAMEALAEVFITNGYKAWTDIIKHILEAKARIMNAFCL